MQAIKILFAVTFLTLPFTVNAQQDIGGVWEGVLVVAPGTEIDVQFSFSDDGSGGWTGLLNAPDQPSLSDVAIDSIAVNGDELSLDISSVSGSYIGTMGSETITGIWRQQGQDFELNLTPYEEPTITAETFALVDGSWIGAIKPVPTAEMELTLVLAFTDNGGGDYSAALSVPDQGAQNIPVDTFVIDGDEVSVRIGQMQLEISGTVSGEQFTGTFRQAGRELPLSMSKGEYEQEGLSLPALAYNRLQGPWHGTVQGLNVVIRVEQSGDNYFAYLDSPDQGAADIPVTTMSLEEDTLVFTIQAAGVEFNGELAEGEIVGTWNQAGGSTPLTLVQGPYDMAAGLDAATRQALLGTWTGTVNNTELQFTFAETDGAYGASLAIPSMGASELGLSELSMDGEQLSFSVRGIQASFNGSLDGDQLNGEWTRAGNTNPLNLSRGQ